MEMVKLSSLEQYFNLPKNEWNIKQHPNDEVLESVFDRGELDLVLAPGLGFAQNGDRLGRGKGYYDQFFSKCSKELKKSPYKIGLAIKEQIVPEIPMSDNDVKLDLVIYAD